MQLQDKSVADENQHLIYADERLVLQADGQDLQAS